MPKPGSTMGTSQVVIISRQQADSSPSQVRVGESGIILGQVIPKQCVSERGRVTCQSGKTEVKSMPVMDAWGKVPGKRYGRNKIRSDQRMLHPVW